MTTQGTPLASMLSAWREDVDSAAFAEPRVRALLERRWRVLRVESGGMRYIDKAGVEAEIPDDLSAAEARTRIAALSQSGPLVLRFAQPLGFRTVTKFPVAAASHLDSAARLALPRLSPLPPSNVALAVEHHQADPDSENWLQVHVAIVRKDRLEASLQRAAELDLTPVATDLEGAAPRAAPAYDLRTGKRGSGGHRSVFRWAMAVAAVALIVSASAWADRSLRLQPRLSAIQSELVAEPVSEAANAQAQLKASAGSATIALADLSRRLPDGAYITALDLRDGILRISGFANDAAAALRALDASPEFDGAAFAGATVRDDANGLERFEIVLTHVPASGAES
ncbi:MAG: PilN domain-containing protein [Oceanicaulis sp.]|nr:PilN domain-containing protein [Oceanicaulis sp.]